jgi:hypothetical protein
LDPIDVGRLRRPSNAEPGIGPFEPPEALIAVAIRPTTGRGERAYINSLPQVHDLASLLLLTREFWDN